MIYFEEYEINAADLGDCNPLPDIKNVTYIHAKYTLTERVTKEESADFGKGMINTMLPYMLQDGYNRDRKKKKFNAVRLENKYLRAIFLPELGGRLWSLYDKEGKRELLYKNSVFQPANLALRNAWFSGGIEFNVAIKGHNPLTCSRLFAEIICCNGEEVLRMYEFERIREITYSICAFLPEDSRVLYIKDCIENTSDDEKYSYWWSNIAVPESPRIRVIVPAPEAYLSSYNEGNYVVDKIPVPVNNGKDLSYPNNSPRSQDFFYKIPDHAPKWIAAVGDDGRGIIQFSQQRMIGRKLFVWGQGKGGRNWNEWLSEKGESYVEIQAGLSRTQLEHIPMKAHERWEWVEAYGAVNCDREAVHSSNWLKAQNAVKSAFGDSLEAEIIEKRLSEVFPDLSVGRRKFLCCGSGWGALENKLRALENNPPVSVDCDFPEKSLDCEQEPWLYLLEHGVFPDIAPEATPVSYVSGRKWRPLLENLSSNREKTKRTIMLR